MHFSAISFTIFVPLFQVANGQTGSFHRRLAGTRGSSTKFFFPVSSRNALEDSTADSWLQLIAGPVFINIRQKYYLRQGRLPILFEPDARQLMDKPDWLLAYKATEDFNISDVSPQSFKPQGSSNFLKYYLFNSVSAGGDQCDEKCKTGQLCGITEIDFDQYDACLQGLSSSTASSTSTPSNSISVPSGSSSVKFSFSGATFWLFSIAIFLS